MSKLHGAEGAASLTVSPGCRASSTKSGQAPSIHGSTWVRWLEYGTSGIKMDTDTKQKTNINKILQGVASLGNEWSEKARANENVESISLDQPKTNGRYSGAVRRCYKKQLLFYSISLLFIPSLKL